MNQIKIENWNGHEIRFVWHKDEWWAVLKDITDALDLKTWKVNQRLTDDILSKYMVESGNGQRQMSIINEIGIYEAVFSSRKPEAKEFKQWVYSMLRELRQASGLEGFQIFRMLDKDHQKEAMAKLKDGLKKPVRVDFIKANTITNKAISNMTGSPKMIKKGDMTPGMLVQRQAILDDTVELMTAVDKFNLDCSVSQKIYDRYH
jgi:prophage antirepressor-like protein